MNIPRSIGQLRSIGTLLEFLPTRNLRRRNEEDTRGFGYKVESVSRRWALTSAGRLSLSLGGAALALLIFVRVTRELIEGDVSAGDNRILAAVERIRTPWLTSAAVDVTALGSITLVILFSAFALVVLLFLRDWLGALQLLAASTGA